MSLGVVETLDVLSDLLNHLLRLRRLFLDLLDLEE